MQSLYVFLSASPYRWEIFTSQGVTLVLKALCGTRWSERADAAQAMKENYSKIQKALELLSVDMKQDADARHQALCLMNKMQEFEIAFLTVFWNDVLSRMNKISKLLQKEDADLALVVNLLTSLQAFIQTTRSKFEDYEKEAMILIGCSTPIYKESNKRVKKPNLKNSTDDVVLTARDKLKTEVFLVAVDKLSSELARRSAQYKALFERFSFITEILTLSDLQISNSCEKLCTFYPKDFDAANIESEFIHFKCHLQTENVFEQTKKLFISEMYQYMYEEKLFSIFSNVEIAMRIFLSIMPSNASGERSFSRLSLIKDDHRTTMTQKKLNQYSVWCIENELLKSIDCTSIIEEFVGSKIRKKCF